MPRRPFMPPSDPAECLRLARQKIEASIGRVQESIHLREANRIIIYSNQLSSQIPLSRAGVAYQMFVHTMFKGQVSKLSALWDGPGTNRNSLPTIASLVDRDDVKALIRASLVDTRVAGRHLSAQDDDPELLEWLTLWSNTTANQDAEKAMEGLQSAILTTAEISARTSTRAMMDFRNVHLAHHLDSGAADPELKARYGDENALLADTILVLESFNNAVRGSSFMWEEAIDIAREDAEALWNNCSFNITTR